MTHIDPKWEQALNEPADTFTLFTYVKQAHAALMDLGEETGMADAAQAKAQEFSKEPNPAQLLRLYIKGIRDLKRDYISKSS